MRPEPGRKPVRRTIRRPSSIAPLLLVLFALTAAGCGDDSDKPDESPPQAPKLSIPNGSVESDARDSGSTDSTGSTGSSDTAGTDTSAGTDPGGATTTTPPPQNTGGQGPDETQQDGGQNTGGAAPGN
ncbi:MAG: hypothetical protein WAO61_04380 [Solirubrobacterales bacterium]